MEGARRSAETQAAATPLPAYVVEFRSVFAKEDFDILPEHCKWDHAIELTPGAEPKSSKVYPLSPLEQAELDAFLEENLRTRRIRPLKSSIAAPMFFIKKKDGSLCLVQEQISAPSHLQTRLSTLQSPILHKTGRPLGFQ